LFVEKQFGIRSQEAAWIFSGNEISQIFFILVLPFLPRIKKRTLWTSVAMLFSALGKNYDLLNHGAPLPTQDQEENTLDICGHALLCTR
jgi:hypothetical protein